MYAVIATGGKQLKVEEGQIVDIERVAGEPGSTVAFKEVLAIGEKADIQIGTPFLDNALVEGELVNNFRGPKLIAFKMKRRKGYRKTKGHRQELSKVKITKLELK